MATLPDLLYVALFSVAMPLWDYLVSWPAFHRRLRADPARARRRLWIGAIGYPWALVAVGAALWMVNDRPWTSLGFSVPAGWRLWVAVGLVPLLVVHGIRSAAAVARDLQVRADLRQQIGQLADVLPRTRTELYWFAGVSLTAEFCEEFLFRGYFIWTLAPWLGWWGGGGTLTPDLRERTRLPGMEWRPPHGSRRRILHAGGSDLRLPLAGDRASRPRGPQLWNRGVARAAGGVRHG